MLKMTKNKIIYMLLILFTASTTDLYGYTNYVLKHSVHPAFPQKGVCVHACVCVCGGGGGGGGVGLTGP